MKRIVHLSLAGVGLAALIGLGGCSPSSTSSPSSTNSTPSSPTTTTNAATNAAVTPAEAICVLSPTQGNDVQGMVTFIQETNGVEVVADVTGLTPGKHGFHIHESGDCSAPDASSAGGHFNPTGMPHGGPDSAQHHMGDLGNITADASGKAHLDHVFSFLEWNGTNSFIGRGLIVHAGEDDLTSQPSGNAGARVACGKIVLK